MDKFLKYSLLLYLVPLFMGLSEFGMFTFPDPSYVLVELVGGSPEYHYISKNTGEECGIIQDYTFTGVFAYAYPTQWWNYTNFDQRGGSVQTAKNTMQKYCPVDEKP